MAAVFTAFEWLLGQTPTSGAIDVVAIKNADGKINCGPFHVKLAKGKKDVRVVKLKVNGKETDLKMKVGRAGEAFFVEHSEEHEYITRRLRSSPPLSPGTGAARPAEGIEIYKNPSAEVATPLTKVVKDEIRMPVEQSMTCSEKAEPEAAAEPIAPKPMRAKDAFTMSTQSEPDGLYSADTPPLSYTIDTGAGDSSALSPRPKQAAWTWTWGDLPIKSSKNRTKNPIHDAVEAYPSSVVAETAGSSAGDRASELPPRENVDGTPANHVQVSHDSEHLAVAGIAYHSSPIKQRTAAHFTPCRMFSLCGHILSELVKQDRNDLLLDPNHLLLIVRSHALSRHDFFQNPAQYLRNPDLVVLVGDTLLTWPVAKVMFETVVLAHHELVSHSDHEAGELEVEDEVVRICLAEEKSAEGDVDTIDTSSSAYARAEHMKQPCWAGKRITHWFSEDGRRVGSHAELPSQLAAATIVALEGSADLINSPATENADMELGIGLYIDRNSLDNTNSAAHNDLAAPKCAEHVDVEHSAADRETQRRAIEDNWEAYLQSTASRIGTSAVSPTVSSASLVQFFHDNHIQDVSLDFLSSYHSFIINKSCHSANNLSGMGTRKNSFFFPNVKDSSTSHDFFLDQIPDSVCEYETEELSWIHPSDSDCQLWTWGDEGGEHLASHEVEVYKNDNINIEIDVMDKEDVQKSGLPLATTDFSESASGVSAELEKLPITDKELNLKQLSLLEISLEDICPGPARGEMYGYQHHDFSDTDSYYSLSLDEGDEGAATDGENGPDGSGSNENTEVTRKIPRKYLYRKSLVPTQQQLETMGLVDGENEIIFEVEGCDPVTAQLFVRPYDAKLVVADIEGMILQPSKPKPSSLVAVDKDTHASDGWGSLFFSFGASAGSDVAAGDEATSSATHLLHDIAKNGYHIVYIATKSMTQSSSTKIELVKASEKSSSRLPPGPVFLSPDTLVRSFESQRPDLFKAAVLRGTRSLFPTSHNPFYSGFCTNDSDMQAFLRCGFPEGRIFLASETSEIKVMNRTTKWTYKDMHSFLYEMFPIYFDSQSSVGSKPNSCAASTEDAYNDFNFWKVPIRTV